MSLVHCFTSSRRAFAYQQSIREINTTPQPKVSTQSIELSRIPQHIGAVCVCVYHHAITATARRKRIHRIFQSSFVSSSSVRMKNIWHCMGETRIFYCSWQHNNTTDKIHTAASIFAIYHTTSLYHCECSMLLINMRIVCAFSSLCGEEIYWYRIRRLQ